MAQRRFFIAVRHPLERAASSTPPQIPLGDKTVGNTTTLGQPALRINLGATSSKENKDNAENLGATSSKDRNLGATSSKVEKKTQTTPKLQGYGRNENVNNNDNKQQDTGIEPATSSVMKLCRNQLNHPTFQKDNKNKGHGHREPRKQLLSYR